MVQFFAGQPAARLAVIGTIEILHAKPVALICSVKCPGNIIIQTYDFARVLRDSGVPVVGGFHSPMERECLRILLRGSQPLIVCPARSLERMRVNQEFRTPLNQGRLLFLSSFPQHSRRATAANALYRNQFVCALANHIFVPYASPAGKTFELCRDLLLKGKSLYTFPDESNESLLKLGAKPLSSVSEIL